MPADSFPIDRPLNPQSTFWLLTVGPQDPTWDRSDPRQTWLTQQTPDGPVVLRIIRHDDRVDVLTEGDGSDWLQPHLPSMLGLNFTPPDLSHHTRLRRLAGKRPGLRIPRLPLVTHRLIQIVLQQLVSFRDAALAWRDLVRRYGIRVSENPDLFIAPNATALARLSPDDITACGVLPRFSRLIIEVARLSQRIEQRWNAGQSPDSVDQVCEFLAHIRGIGPWTIGYLRGAGLGDTDAVIPGDYSHPRSVSWFFEGRRDGADAEMLRLLEPFRPFRFYVLTLILQAAPPLPRRGPRSRSIRRLLR